MTYSSEVLADSPLAYWRLGDAAVVAPTAATSSTNFSSEPPSNAIDGNSGTYWTTNGFSSGWLRLQFPSAVKLTTYAIRRRDDIPARNAKAWTFEGSNDGTAWTVLDTRTNITWPTAGETKSFSFANSTAFTYYRLNVSANNGDTYLSVAELSTSFLTDSSGNSRPMYPFGGVALGAAGLLDGDTDTAASFNGTTAYTRIPDYVAWMSPAAVTVEAIIKTTATGFRAIIDRDGVAARAFQFRLNSGVLEFITINGGAGVVTASGGAGLNDGVRHHVAATYDASNIRLYVDGVLVKTQAAVGALSAEGATLSLGANFSGSGASNLWTGTIDEAAYYGTALSGARITAHYAAIAGAPAGVTGTVAATAPAPTLTASGTVTRTGTVTATAPSPTLTVTGDALPLTTGTIQATAPAPSLTVDGTVAGVTSGTIDATPAPPTVAVTGTVPTAITGTVSATAPAPSVSVTDSTNAATVKVGLTVETGAVTLLRLVTLPGTEVRVGSDLEAGASQPVTPLPGTSVELGASIITRQPVADATDPRRRRPQWRYVITDLAHTPLGELTDIEHDPVEDGIGEPATMQFTIATDSDQHALIKPIERQCQVWEGDRLRLRGPILPGRASDDGTTITYDVHDPSWFWRDGRRVITRIPQKNLIRNGDFKHGLTWWTRGFDTDSIPKAAPKVVVVSEDFSDDTDGLDPIKAAEVTGVESVTESELASNAVFWPNRPFKGEPLAKGFRPGGEAAVDAVANAMPDTPGLKVTIVGHTANDGTGSGVPLSLRRAEAAAARIKAKRPKAIITTKGVGFYDPKPGFPVGSQEQRRVVISYDQTISGKSRQWMRQTVEVTQPKEARYPLELTAAAMLKVADNWNVQDANMVSVKIVARRKGIGGNPDAKLPWNEQLGVGESSISDTDPVDRWIPQTASATVPADGRPYLVDVYLYAPAALARYTAVGLFPEEMLYFWGVDQAAIFRGIIQHMQDPAFGHGDLGVGTRSPATGVRRDREFAFRDLTPVDTALDGLAGISRGIEWDTLTTATTTTAAAFYPRQGKTVDYVLALGGNVTAASPASTRDVGSSVIAQAQGLGSYRAVAYAKDTRAFGGALLERVITAEQDTPLNELRETAKAELFWAKSSTPAYWVDIDPDSIEDVMHHVGKGDTVRLILDHPAPVDALARVVRRQIHPDSVRLMVAFEEA